ncbi:MAG: glycosyltransferase family 2 protein [Mogibacterium sp.]|nr:glycosyltransferase family 2 protein [Mogibacterium sp.]
MLYSIVIPCYNSSRSIRQVVELTMQELDRIGRTPYEFVLVDDCSPDGGSTLQELRALADDHACVCVVELAKNSGQHNATMAGLNYAKGDAIISMDDDLQTHPSQLPVLFEEFDKGFDIVYGYYPEKKHSPFRNFGSWVNYETVRILIGKPKDMKTSSFWIMQKFVRDYIIQYKNQYTHLQGLILRTTRNISSVPVQHFERAYGSSNYTFKKLIQLWSNILGYSVVPLRLARYLGMVFSALGLIGALVVLIRKLVHPAVAMGWSSVMVSIFFFSGMIMLFLGLIGEYIGRMFLGMSNYPQFVVRQVYTRGTQDEKAASVPETGAVAEPAD